MPQAPPSHGPADSHGAGEARVGPRAAAGSGAAPQASTESFVPPGTWRQREPPRPSNGDPATVSLLAPGSELAERFEIRAVLGHGGFAVVYRAWDRLLRHEVALKVLRADRLTPQAVARLRREVAVAREAQSRHLVRVYDLGEAGAQVFVTMELVDGESLRDRLGGGPLPIEEAIAVLRGVLAGLADLHALPVVHRDVKPGNVLLANDGTVKLADFGLARWLDRDETRATAHEAILGTVDYMAPEQVLGGDVDARSDLYSAGMLAFEMLTGEHPFPGDSSLGTLIAHVRTRAPNVRTRRPEVPRWLAALVDRLLEKEPNDRHRSAAEALRALDSRATVRAVLPQRTRQRLVAAAVVIGAMALLGGAVIWRNASGTVPTIRLVQAGPRTVEAIDRSGRVLWQREDQVVSRMMAIGRLRPHEPARVVALHYADFAPEESERDRRTLDILDERTGTLIERVVLPAGEFAGLIFDFAPTYTPYLRLFDLDRDGYSEVVVSFLHMPLYPSYTVLYEPRLRRARLLFVGSGHHRPTGALDLDGDGTLELLLGGINNRMGWSSAHVAIRLYPPVNLGGATELPDVPVTSPDLDRLVSRANDQLVWYALGPKWPAGVDDEIIETAADGRTLRYRNRADWLALDLDGFRADVAATVDHVRRSAARGEAYQALREAEKLLAHRAPAVEALARARAAAEESAEPTLIDWIVRRQAVALVQAGSRELAEATFERAARGEVEPEVAFDAGLAFHLAGELERAIGWYRRGLAATSRALGGRTASDFLDGLVLASLERGQGREALTLLEQLRSPVTNEVAAHLAFLRWRLGLPTALPPHDVSTSPDLVRYWVLELRRHAGETPVALRRAAEEELARSTEALPLLRALLAQLLADEGDPRGAIGPLRSALLETYAAAEARTWARGHLDLLVERLVALAGATGQPSLAAEAERELTTWRRRHRVD